MWLEGCAVCLLRWGKPTWTLSCEQRRRIGLSARCCWFVMRARHAIVVSMCRSCCVWCVRFLFVLDPRELRSSPKHEPSEEQWVVVVDTNAEERRRRPWSLRLVVVELL